MEDRALLEHINYEEGTIRLGENNYQLQDTGFPTIDPENPYELSQEEAEVMERLIFAFENCEKLQRHMRFLLKKEVFIKFTTGTFFITGVCL